MNEYDHFRVPTNLPVKWEPQCKVMVKYNNEINKIETGDSR